MDPETHVKNFSVIKISNKFTVETSTVKKDMSFTVSTEIKKDGEEGNELEEDSDHHHHGEDHPDVSILGKSEEGTQNNGLDASAIINEAVSHISQDKEEDTGINGNHVGDH